MTTLPKVLAWSYSRYADYNSCPAKFMYKHLMKLPDAGSPAMARGNAIHKMAEQYVLGELKTIPPELKNVKAELTYLKSQDAVVEQAWGFKGDWNWTGKPGWFGDEVWFRMKADVAVIYDDNTALVGDWKTGKMYFSNEEQVELFAAVTFMRYPQLTDVDVRLWYTDSPPDSNEIQREYTAADGALIRKDWEKRSLPMFKDRKFPPKPNQWCGNCNFSKGKGGPCKF